MYIVKVKVHIAKLTLCYFHINMTVKVSENPPGRSYYGFYSGLTLLGDSCTLWCVKTIHWGTIRPQSITASSAASKKTATNSAKNGGLTSNLTLPQVDLCICLDNYFSKASSLQKKSIFLQGRTYFSRFGQKKLQPRKMASKRLLHIFLLTYGLKYRITYVAFLKHGQVNGQAKIFNLKAKGQDGPPFKGRNAINFRYSSSR